MASRVNTRFVALLIIGLMLLVGGGMMVAYFALAKSGADLAAQGDKFMAEGEYEKAYQSYGKAVHKKKTNAEWIDKWLKAMQKTTPTPRQVYMERYSAEYRQGLKAYAEALPEDVGAQKRYLDELFQTLRNVSSVRSEDWNMLILATEDAIKRFPDADGPARELRRFRAFANLAQRPSLSKEQVAASATSVREDLTAALAANPNDAEATVELVSLMMQEAEDKRRAGASAEETDAIENRAHAMLGEFNTKYGADSRVLWSQILIEFLQASRGSTRPTRAELYESKHGRLTEMADLLKSEAREQPDIFVVTRFADEARRSPRIGNAGVLDMLYEIEKKHPTNVSIKLLIGRYEVMSHHYEKAVAAYQKIVDSPDLPLSFDGWKLFQQRAEAYRSQIMAKLSFRDYALEMIANASRNPSGVAGIDEAKVRAALSEAEVLRGKLAEYVGETDRALLYVDAKLEYAKGNLERARTKLDDYNQQTFNQDVSALVLQGEIMERIQNTGAARAAYLAALSRDPLNFDAMFRLAGIEEREQNFDAAVKILEEAQKSLPNVDMLNERLSRTRQLASGIAKGGQTVEDSIVRAVLAAQEAVAGINPDYAAAADILQRELVRQRQIPAGMPTGTNQDVIVLYPMLTQMLTMSGKPAEALVVVKEGLALSPGHPRLTALRTALEAKDPLQGSLAAIDGDEKATPFQKHVWRYFLFAQFGKKAEATTELESAMKLEPEHPILYEVRFKRALEEKNIDEARRIAEAVAAKNIDNTGGLTYKAQIEVYDQRYADAAATLEAALEKDRNSVAVWRQLGELRMALGRAEPASRAFASALAVRPKDLHSIKGFMRAKAAMGQMEEALQFARDNERVGVYDVEFVDLWLELESRARGGDVRSAIEQRQQLAKRFADDPTANKGLMERNNVAIADLLIASGRLEEARLLIERLRREGDSDAYVQADVRWNMAAGNIRNAIEVFNKWVTSLPPERHTEAPYIALAAVFSQYGRYDAAIQSLKDGRTHQSAGSTASERALGELQFRLRRYDQAIETFNGILAKNPADPELALNLYVVEAYTLTKRYDEALARIASLGAAAVSNSKMQLLRADSLAGKGEIGEAGRTYDAAIALSKDNAIGYIKRAEFLSRDERYLADARQDLEQALKLDPRHLGARRLLVNLHRRSNDSEKAVEVLRSGLVADPDNDTMRLDLIGLHLSLKQDLQAIAVVEEVLRRRAEDPYWLLQGREVMYVLKRWNDAEKYALRLWEKKKDVEAALAYVDAALKMDKTDFVKVVQVLGTPELKTDTDLRLLMARARVQLKRQRAREATEDMAKAMALIDANNPSQSQMYMSGMTVLYTDPKERLRALTALRPQDGYRSWMAFFYSNLKTSIPESASEGLAELRAIAESNAAVALRKQSYAIIGSRMRAEKKYDEAVNWWKEGLKLDAADPELNNNIAYCLAEDMKKPQEALPFGEKAAEVLPESASIQDTVGWIYYNLGQMDKAEAALVRAMTYAASREEQIAVLIHLSRVKLKGGNKAEAEGLMHRAEEVVRENEELKVQYGEDLTALRGEIQK